MLKKGTVALIAFLLLFGSFGNESYAKTVSRHAGIGDTKVAFNKAYGKARKSADIYRYKHDYILAMFMGRPAFNITLQFEATAHPHRSKKATIKAYKKMIPSDAKKVKQYSDDGGQRTIIFYQSKRLAKMVKKSVFMGDKRGSFMAILHKNKKGYFSVVLGTGTNP